jgi:hypothetical protein
MLGSATRVESTKTTPAVADTISYLGYLVLGLLLDDLLGEVACVRSGTQA